LPDFKCHLCQRFKDGKVLLADPEESDKDEAAAEKHDEQVDKAKESQKRHLEAASLGCQKPPR